ncbi:MAG: hypothetical protein WAV05_11575 [Anaerolineales bacterium]
MSFYSTLLLAGFFFIMGAAVIGFIWYLQGAARGNSRKGKEITSSDPNLAEVARLMRDTQTQDLVVGMNGKTFRAASELNSGQSRRLNFASNVLVKWLVESTPPTLPVEEPSDAPTSEPDTQDSEWIPAESAPIEDHHGYTPPFTADLMDEVKPVSTKVTDVVGGILNPTPAPPTPQFKSIAMQINDILQDMMVGTQFAKRGITVNDAPDKGVMVTVDGEKYPGVKDVPDEEVRNLIRSAVVEWEKAGKPSSR